MALSPVHSHITAGQRLRAQLAAASDRLWADLGSYDRKDADRWLEQILPLALAGRRTAVALMDGFVAVELGRDPLGITPEAAPIRNGADPAEVYERPLHTVWMALGAGALWAEAVEAGRARAAATIATDAQLASRSTAAAIQREGGIGGWERVANTGACGFCAAIDGSFVRSADAFPLHHGCSCGLRPREQRQKTSPLPADVEVARHGELGPVLNAPEHHFTTV
jgi:hypothetical protein